MGEISITSEEEGFTNISNNFIEYYMSDVNGDFVKIYLYLAMLCSSKRRITISDIADHLNCTENDICRGIRYWIKMGILKLCYNENKEVTGIVMKDIKRPEEDYSADLKVLNFKLALDTNNSNKTNKTNKNVESESIMSSSMNNDTNNIENDQTDAYEEDTDQIKAPRKKQPTPEELNQKMRDPELENLIQEANAYCNRNLSPKELNSLIYIKDQLAFSFDLCEYLLEYCAEIKKTNFNYIEKVAKNWYEEGITNREDAKEYSQRYLTLYSRILKSLGITNRVSPAPIEKQYIDIWTKEFGFEDVIILEACNRAIKQKPNDATFPYVNGILSAWQKNNVQTLADITSLDEQHEKRKQTNSSAVSTSNTIIKNDDSFDQLMQIEQMALKKGNGNDN